MNLKESIRRILKEERNISDIIKIAAKEYNCSTWEINNGYCEDFALNVLEKLGGYEDNLFELSGDMFFDQRDPEFAKENWGDVIETNYGVWSKNLLDYWGYPPNVNLNLVDDEINHVWLFYNGKHYDAEVPEGVDNWFEIPLIKRLFNRYKKNMVQESIRRILKEETQGIDNFLDEISNTHPMSDELKSFVKQFIEESECKRIDFSNFKIGVLGLALESGVLINSITIRRPLPYLLFVIFHEVAHQYQFKKYGVDVMYDCYLGDITEREAAEFMKQTEEVADEFAARKIRQLQKMGLIEPFTPPQMYKNIPIQQITMMVNNYRNDMRRKNIDSQEKVSEYFYNMVKSEL